ncbi:TPA: hypothetical protein ACRUOP_000659 [Escherichia coli]
MRGKELDTLIEHELQLMLAEGFDKSPISAKALHIRLKAKGIVNGGLSTLSSLERKRLIAAYVDQQIGPLNLRPKEKQQYVNRKTRQALMLVIIFGKGHGRFLSVILYIAYLPKFLQPLVGEIR